MTKGEWLHGRLTNVAFIPISLSLLSGEGAACAPVTSGGEEAVPRRVPGGTRLGRPTRCSAGACPGAKTPTPGHYEPGAVGLLGSSGSPRLAPGAPREKDRRAGTRTSRQEPRGTPGGTWHTTTICLQGRRTGVPLPSGNQDRSLKRPVMTDPGPGTDGACPGGKRAGNATAVPRIIGETSWS